MTLEALTVGLLFLGAFVGVIAVAAHWRRRSPRLAVVTALWALVAFGIPGLLGVVLAPFSSVGADEAQPYVALVILWLFLLIPSAVLLVLGRASLRA